MEQLFYFYQEMWGDNPLFRRQDSTGIVAAKDVKGARRKLDLHCSLKGKGVLQNRWKKFNSTPGKHIKHSNNPKLITVGMHRVFLIESRINSSEVIPKGRYMICDPCYLTVYTENPVAQPIATVGTGGDGGHKDNWGRCFGVDSGRLSIYPGDTEIPRSEARGDLGHVVEFTEDWQLIVVADGTAEVPVHFRAI